MQEIASKIGEALHPLQVLLFGSYADGTATEDSDLDLLVVMESDLPRYKQSAAIRNLFWPPKAPMDILVYTPKEISQWGNLPNHVLSDALTNGKVLYPGGISEPPKGKAERFVAEAENIMERIKRLMSPE